MTVGSGTRGFGLKIRGETFRAETFLHCEYGEPLKFTPQKMVDGRSLNLVKLGIDLFVIKCINIYRERIGI